MKKFYSRGEVLTGVSIFLLMMLGMSSSLFSQVSGSFTIPTHYPSISAFITDINNQGVGSGGATLNVPSGYSEDAPSGGFVITATGTASNPIAIVGNGLPKPVVTASAAHTAGALNDAVFKLIGSDYVTIQNLELKENVANTATTAASNNMTEWGIALLYASVTNGAENCTITGNTISLNRTYQNSMGIYSNSTHAANTPTTSASATGANGGNNGLKIYSNSISNVNLPIVVVGPTAASDILTGLAIGSVSSSSLGNTITDFGSTGTFSSFANMSASVNGIYVRNARNYNIGYNNITSSAGGTTSGILRGIYLQSNTNTTTGVNDIQLQYNTINLQSGSASSTVNGIAIESGVSTTTSSIVISNNNFTGNLFSVASSGTLSLISTVTPVLSLVCNNNTFTNITANTTGTITFIAQGYTMPTNGTQVFNNNSIVGTFSRPSASGTMNVFSTASSSPSGTSSTYSNNNFSNISITGTGSFTGINNTDGTTTSSTKIVFNNTFQNISLTTGAFTGITITYLAGNSSIYNNTISNNSGAGTFTGINIGSAGNTANTVLIYGNEVSNWTGSATTSATTGINVANTSTGIEIYNNRVFGLSNTSSGTMSGIILSGTTNDKRLYRNKVYNLTNNNAGAVVYGISVTSSMMTYIYNNLIHDLKAPSASGSADAIRGISITSGTATSTIGVYHNTILLNASSSGADFSSSGIFHTGNATATTATLDLRNNIILNTSTPSGTGITFALRRTVSNANYSSNSNNNQFFAGTPSAANLVYTDGTNSFQTINNFKTFIAPLESNSVTGESGYNYNTAGSYFISLTGSSNDFLKPVNGITTLNESLGTNITSPIVVNTDFAGVTRPAGSGTAPDLGAFEFEGVAVQNCSGTPTAGTITGASTLCAGSAGTTLGLSGTSSTLGITYQWKSSTTSGGPYNNLGTSSTQATGTLSQTTYFVAQITCSNSGQSSTTPEFTITVNPQPVVTVTGQDTICSGLSSTLTASGADTYSWSPAATLSSSTGSTVTATPTANTTYTVVGTITATGCTNSATKAIVVVRAPLATATASPNSVCSGASSNLDVISRLPSAVNNYTFSHSMGATLYDMTGATTLLTSSNDDDPTPSSSPIGFNFSFNGTNYSNFSVSPDGWILLGTTAAVSQFTNAVVSTTNIPKIYPYWDDLATGNNGYVQSLVVGNAPNRILVVEWFVTIPRSTTGAANSKFQTWLYEKDGKVEFVYGSMGSGSMSASVGLTGGATNFHSATISNLTSSTTTANNSVSGQPILGQKLTYSLPISNLNYGYAWTPSANLSNPSAKNPVASNITNSGYYTVTVSGYGCSNAVDSVLINAGQPLGSSISATPNTTCEGGTVNLVASGVSGGAPYTYSWSGPNGFTSTSGSNVLSNTTVAQSGRYYVTITDNCAASKMDSVDVLVNPQPNTAIASSAPVYCAGDPGLTLTASGADTYAWSPAGGLSGTTGNVVTATPAGYSMYTVVGTFTATGCTKVASINIQHANKPTISSTTATPSAICEGETSSVAVVATQTVAANQMPFSTNTGSSLYPLTSPITALTSSNDDTPSGVQPLGFTFSFNNVNYTDFSVSPDGWILLGTATATSQFTNAVVSATNTPKLYPYWDDLATGSNGNVRYEVLGVAPNRILVVQWFVTVPRVTTGPANSTFQLALHETTNEIEYIYGAMGPQPGGSTSIGLTATPTNYQSITISTASTSPNTANNSNTGVPVNGRRYRFTPVPFTLSYSWTPATDLVSSTNASSATVPLTASTTFIPTVSNSYGCSRTGSGVTVTVNQHTSSTANVSACGPYTTPNGTVRNQSGTYMDTIPNANGCDSVITTNLTIHAPSSSTVNVTACHSYTMNGATYNQSGTYGQVIPNANGCDSTITLNLTIIPNSTSSLSAAQCGPYTGPSGMVYSQSGTYFDTIPNSAGCDSIITLNLTIYGTTYAQVNAFTCDTYTSPSGMVLSQTGVYNDTIPNANGCDSVITINLTVGSETSSSLTITACNSYTAPSGQVYQVSGQYSDTITNASGCDSVITIQLTINNSTSSSMFVTQCDSYTAPSGAVYTQTGIYTDVIPNAAGCDSIITIAFTLAALDVSITVNNATLTVAEVGASYIWLDCNNNLAPIIGANAQSYTATQNGIYAVRVSKPGCIDTSLCVVVNNVGLDEKSKRSVQISPNPTDGRFAIVHDVNEKVHLEILDVQGRVILQLDDVKSGTGIDLTEEQRGVYLVRLQSGSWTHMERIVKN